MSKLYMFPIVTLLAALASCSIFDYHLGVGTPVEAGSLSRAPSTAGGVDYDAPTTVWLGLSYSPSSHKQHRESMEQRERHALMRLGTERYESSGDITVTVDAEGGYTATEVDTEVAAEVEAEVESDLDLPVPQDEADEAPEAPAPEEEHIVEAVIPDVPTDWSGGIGVLLWCIGICLVLLTAKATGVLHWLLRIKKKDADG